MPYLLSGRRVQAVESIVAGAGNRLGHSQRSDSTSVWSVFVVKIPGFFLPVASLNAN